MNTITVKFYCNGTLRQTETRSWSLSEAHAHAQEYCADLSTPNYPFVFHIIDTGEPNPHPAKAFVISEQSAEFIGDWD